MTLYQKRLLIFFSAALNIGFVIAALVMMVHHPPSGHKRSYEKVLEIVQQLDLPEDRRQTVLETIRRFRTTIDQHSQALKKARSDVVRLLAASGPVDRQRLEQLTAAMDAAEKTKNRAFETHFLGLRKQLGDAQGARFFSLLLALHEADGHAPRP